MTDTRQVKELLGQGLSRPLIAQRLGTTYHRIRIICDQLGIPRRGNGGRPPRDDSHALVNLLDRIRGHAAKAGLFFRTTKGQYLFYGRPIASFTDAKAAWAWLRNPTRRGASVRLHAIAFDAVVKVDEIPVPPARSLVRSPRLDGSVGTITLGVRRSDALCELGQ